MSGHTMRATNGETDIYSGSGWTSLSGIVGRKPGKGILSPTSPLKLFSHAKQEINGVFGEITQIINECNTFCKGDTTGLIKSDQIEILVKYADNVAAIREVLNRDRMKVVFFGRPSSGKSSVINAMLRDRILPSGLGHTTNCFLQFEGTDEKEAFIITEDAPNERQSVQSIKSLASALSKVKLDPNSLIRICWPKEMCSLLQDDVVLVDSPGIDVSPDLDSWINKFCMDADVFVLVGNAESTLMQTEKNFFHRVSECLSKPNIFILNNRWDASASELETMHEVKQQHLERSIGFLVNELKVVQKHAAENRVFFVSAREVLISRLYQDKGTQIPAGQLMDGHKERLLEFENFEKKFEECISQSAVEIKFAQHTHNGKQIIQDLHALMEQIHTAAIALENELHQKSSEKQNILHYTDNQLCVLREEMENKIKQVTEEFEHKVSYALSNEIECMSDLVDTFKQEFDADSLISLNSYKKGLRDYVENCLEDNLKSRCLSKFSPAISNVKDTISDKMMPLISDALAQNILSNLIQKKDFDISYHFDCRKLCDDFCEDINFQFSFGITSLMRRFLGQKGFQKRMTGYTEIPQSIPLQGQASCSEVVAEYGQNNSELLLTLLTKFGSCYSSLSLGFLGLACITIKATGMKAIFLAGIGFFGYYMLERLMWTNSAKEKALKRQFADYSRSKFSLIVHHTSLNCSHQVEKELTGTLNQFCNGVDVTKTKLGEEIQGIEESIKNLKAVTDRATFLRNRTTFVDTELDNFIHQFLKADHL